MKKADLIFILIVVLLFGPFVFSDDMYRIYLEMTASHAYAMAFIKFAVLATLGEMLGLRIKSGRYCYKGFGVAPRALVWGVFGVVIAGAMKVFSTGVPVMLESFGVEGAVEAMQGDFTCQKFFSAFCISVVMNTFFAPVFMTMHKITDTHIINYGGNIEALAHAIPMAHIMEDLNWKVQWNFVFKKTIPLFWFPAHTITFLLPSSMQVLFAALLSIFLGVLLSVAAVLSRQKEK